MSAMSSCFEFEYLIIGYIVLPYKGLPHSSDPGMCIHTGWKARSRCHSEQIQGHTDIPPQVVSAHTLKKLPDQHRTLGMESLRRNKCCWAHIPKLKIDRHTHQKSVLLHYYLVVNLCHFNLALVLLLVFVFMLFHFSGYSFVIIKCWYLVPFQFNWLLYNFPKLKEYNNLKCNISFNSLNSNFCF